MTTLRETISAFKEELPKTTPADILATMDQCTLDLKASGIENQALTAGDSMPDFELPNQHGELRRLSHYLAESPVVLNVYRGGWCPYCNMEMKALHDALPEIEARGTRLIGLTPETPDQALDTAKNNDMSIDILSDVGNRVSRQLGLVFQLPAALRPIYEKFGIDLPAHNGDHSFELPVPATYIIGRNGVIVYAYIDADYTSRMEPSEIIAQLDQLKI